MRFYLNEGYKIVFDALKLGFFQYNPDVIWMYGWISYGRIKKCHPGWGSIS